MIAACLAVLVAAPALAAQSVLPPRLPLARAPTNALEGATTEARSAELLAWFRQRYGDRLNPETPLFHGMVDRLARTPVLDSRGRHRVHPAVFGAAIASYNVCAQIHSMVQESDAPVPVKGFLAPWFGRLAFDEGETPHEGEARACVDGLTPQTPTLWVTQCAGLADALRRAVPAFADAPPLVRKLALDRIAERNPHVRFEFHRVFAAPQPDPPDGVAVTAGGSTHVFSYRVTDTNGPVVIPAAEQIRAWARAPGHVDLRAFRVPDFTLLRDMAPESLDLSGAATRDLAPLAAMKSLRRLALASTAVSNLAPLAGLPLEELDLTRTAVSDLAPLRGMPLRRLLLSGTAVSDLAALHGLKLEHLDVLDTRVTDLAPLRAMPLRDLLLPRRLYANADVLRSLSSLETVSDYPPEAWFQACARPEWREPVPVFIDRMRGGGRIELKFDTDGDRRYPCDSTTLHFTFDSRGMLARAFAIVAPDTNVLHGFAPTVLQVQTNTLRCEAVVGVARGKKTDHLYKIQAQIRDDAVAGTFYMRYEVEIHDPNRGYSVRVYEPTGAVTGRCGRAAPGAHPIQTVAGTWPDWRGPLGDGCAASNGPALVENLAQARLVWMSEAKTPTSHTADGRMIVKRSQSTVSGGYAGPVVADGRVFVYYYEPSAGPHDDRLALNHARQDGHDRRKWRLDADDVVLCLDAATGRTEWMRVFARAGLNLNGYNDGSPQPALTPCAANGRVYAVGTAGRVYALDVRTGDTVWESHLGPRWESLERARRTAHRIARLPRLERHFANSPVVTDGVLICSDQRAYVGRLGVRQSGLLGMDAQTGDRLWHIPDICDLTASPIRWTAGGREYVLASSEGEVRCLAPRTGQTLWTAGDARFATAPALTADRLVCNDAKNEKLCGYAISPGRAERTWTMGKEYAAGSAAPVIAGEHVWVDRETGLACIHAATGRFVGTNKWAHSSVGMIALGDRTLIEGFRFGWMSNGVPRVTAPWAAPHARGTAPAVVDGRLFFRAPSAVFCYDLRADRTD